jgi:hypothetical protein
VPHSAQFDWVVSIEYQSTNRFGSASTLLLAQTNGLLFLWLNAFHSEAFLANNHYPVFPSKLRNSAVCQAIYSSIKKNTTFVYE